MTMLKTPTMTLEEFARTRRYHDDLGTVVDDIRWEEQRVPPAGFTYEGNLYIELVQPHWPEDARRQGGWHLLLGNEEWITNDLSELEERLYQFAVDSGYVHEPEEPADPADTAKAAELLDQRLVERDAELKQLRQRLAELGEGHDAKRAELAELKRGYDRMIRETRELATLLGKLLTTLDNHGWNRTLVQARIALAKHEEAVRG
jgi:hypothetical protein